MQGLTASYLVREVNPAGRDLLVTAAGGGVGSLLIQLALQAGARRVIAAASSEAKRAQARTLGAEVAIGYDELGSVAPTMIYDSVGGDVLPRCLEILAPKGTLVTYGALNLQDFNLGVPDLKRIMFGNQTFRGFTFGPLIDLATIKSDLAQLFALAADGRLAVTVGQAYPLANAAHAHRALADRAAVGKLVLHP